MTTAERLLILIVLAAGFIACCSLIAVIMDLLDARAFRKQRKRLEKQDKAHGHAHGHDGKITGSTPANGRRE